LSASHALEDFDCAEVSLNDWLKRRAGANQVSGATRTFVSTAKGQVAAYYALAASAVAPAATSGRFRHNMPDPIPVVVLARLAVHCDHQGKGLGRALFQDAAWRVIHAADAIGIRGLLVLALSDDAKRFYEQLGLQPSALDPWVLMTTVADLKAALTNP
jgi:predicted N-acetyltransferase YhbS